VFVLLDRAYPLLCHGCVCEKGLNGHDHLVDAQGVGDGSNGAIGVDHYIERKGRNGRGMKELLVGIFHVIVEGKRHPRHVSE